MQYIKGSNRQPIEMTRGDSEVFQISITNNGSIYHPQTGDVVRFAMRRKRLPYIVYPPAILIEKEIPHDTMQLVFEPEDTKGLPIGRYVYDMKITFADGRVKTFVRLSPFILKEEVE